MNKFFLLRGLFLITCTFGISGIFAQEVYVQGKIIDAETGEPVIAAHIIKPDGTGTYSGQNGRFGVTVDALPVTLRITHISYGESEVQVPDPAPQELVVRLEKEVSMIGEVQVAAEKLRILSEQDDYTIQDFAFDRKNMWMIGYLNNQANKGRLWLTTWFGDTISSLPVRAPEKLFRDVFGNVHLVMRDSVYQLYAHEDSIMLVYSASVRAFESTMTPIKAGFAGKLVYQTFLEGEEGLHTYYYDGEDQQPHYLACIRDTLEESRQEYDHVYGKAGSKLSAYAMETDDFKRVGMIMAMGEKKQTKKSVLNRQVTTPLFSVNDSLYILNLYKDSLLSYDRDGQFVDAVPINFHRDSLLFDVHYKLINFLVDPIAAHVFMLERSTTGWDLTMINYHYGTLGQPVPLPDFPGMYRITAHGNAIYFLYPEKKYPYYIRLYRYQL